MSDRFALYLLRYGGRFFAYQLKEVLTGPNNFEIRYNRQTRLHRQGKQFYPEEKKELF